MSKQPIYSFTTLTITNVCLRYDNLVEEFWKVARVEKDHNSAELKCTSVGFSMSLERMAAILKNMEVEIPPVIKNSEVRIVTLTVNADTYS